MRRVCRIPIRRAGLATLRPGEDQARGLVAVLQPLGIRWLYCSPYRRCRDTLARLRTRPASTWCPTRVCASAGSPRLGARFPRRMAPFLGRFSYASKAANPRGPAASASPPRPRQSSRGIRARRSARLARNAIAVLNYVDPAFGCHESTRIRTPEILKVVQRGGKLSWTDLLGGRRL